MRNHDRVEMLDDAGERVKALAPMIVSASRDTDIPKFFFPWFFDRLDKGYCVCVCGEIHATAKIRM